MTRVLNDAVHGDPGAAARLLPLVYDELRKLAAQRMANESPGQTLQATALVHDAYLRLVDVDEPQHWSGRGHFFAAAAEAMRRILVERARRGGRIRHGGGRRRLDLERLDAAVELRDPSDPAAATAAAEELLALDAALGRLEAQEPAAAAVVKLRCFAGLGVDESAAALGISARTVKRHWAYAKAFLYQRVNGDTGGGH